MMPGMPGGPRMGDMYKLMQRQTDSLSDVPGTLSELKRAASSAVDTIAASKETVDAAKDAVDAAKDTLHGAKETVDAATVTVESAQRSAARIEAAIDQLEEPVLALRASIEALNAILMHPAVQRLPETLELIESAVVPLATGLRGTQDRLSRATRPVRKSVATVKRKVSRAP